MKDITKLENVQKFAMKMCPKQWGMDYQDLLELSQVPALQNRRLYLQLCTIYLWLFLLSFQCICPQVSRHNSSLPLLYIIINPLHTPMPSNHPLYPALHLYGTTYRMKRLLHTTLPLLNHLYHLCSCNSNRVHTRISTFRYLCNPCIIAIIIGKKIKILHRSTIFPYYL